ncbi:MAG: energy transducer TonB [Runella sp.]
MRLKENCKAIMFLTNTSQDREYQMIGFAGATILTSLLLLMMLFVKLYRALPKVQAIEYVEVNFGTDAAGFGKVQTYNKASDSPRAEDVKKSDDTPKVKATPKPTPTPPEPKVATPKPVKTAPASPPVASKVESPVEVKENPKPVKTESKNTAEAETPAKPAPAPKKIDNDALFTKSSGGSKGSNGTTGTASGTGGNNNGDKPGTVGDQGNPQGKIDAGSLYGKPGGASTGIALNVSGWGMGARPQVNDDSDESGRIVFELTVDDTGDITNARVKETTVSQSVVDVYRRAVLKMKLQRKSENVPPISKGTITFIIKSR